MKKQSPILLGVNIDHVATLRQARRIQYPDPVEAAILAVKGGADSITLHLREDRRHIQDHDLWNLKKNIDVPINLEMAVTEEMLAIAKKLSPEYCCLVPEKRQELTTEGGLNVLAQEENIAKTCARLADCGIQVSLFIDPDLQQIRAAARCGVPVVELTTGQYADATSPALQQDYLTRIKVAAIEAANLGLVVNGGHGLNYDNVSTIAAIPQMHELNIGHSIVSFAVFWGMETAVSKMKKIMLRARSS